MCAYNPAGLAKKVLSLNEIADIDIVIVNYKSAPHTVNCVLAVHEVARNDDVAVNVIVVNNGDDADALERDIQDAGGARYLDNAANEGFGAACNRGAGLGTAEFVLFLNPDATVKSGMLRGCLTFLRNPSNAKVGIVGPEITDANGRLVRSCSRLPAFGDLLLRSAGLHTLLPDRSYPYLSAAAHQKTGEVGQVMGAALMIRRSLFHSLRGFDERFFLYYEDVDLCARARNAGFTCVYLKEVQAVHVGRASSAGDSGMSLALHIRSRLIYTRRHFGRARQVVLALICVAIELPLRMVYALLGRGPVPLRAVGRAYALLVSDFFSGRGLPPFGPQAGRQSL